MKDDLSELIAKVETAPADRQGVEIHRALNFAKARGWIDHATWKRAIDWVMVRAYESAALSLVPEGMDFGVGFYREGAGQRGYIARVRKPGVIKPGDEDPRAGYFGTTPAIALVAAALRARAQEGEDAG